MPERIAHAETVEFKRRDGSSIIVQEWPTLVALDALDDIIDAYEELKEDGVIQSIMNVKLNIANARAEDGTVNADDVMVDRSSQAEQFVGVLKALKQYRPKFLGLLCKAIVVDKSKSDVQPEDLTGWFTEELYDLVHSVYEANFVKGSLKKVREKIANRTKAASETISETEE